MAIAPESIEEVKSQANVYDVISEYLSLEKVGSSYRALCPFHSEKTPSFYVSPQKNIWKCFGCGKSGNAITFLMEYEGLSFSQAIQKLAEKYNITLKFTGKNDFKENIKYYSLIEKVARFYKNSLKTNPNARKYLSDREVLPSTIDKFDIGFSPEDDSFINWVEKEGIDKKELVEIGVLSSENSRKDKFAGRIIFPIKNLQGRIVAFGARAIDPNKSPKYLNSPDTKIYKKSDILYGFFECRDFIRQSKELILVEGYFDVILPYQVGIKNVVATLGTALSLKQAKEIKKFASKVHLMFDSDDAGKKAAIRAAKLLLYEGLDVFYVPLYDKDPDELAKKGSQEFKKVLKSGKPILEFLLDKIKETDNIHKRKKLIDLFLELLSYMQDKVLQGEYLNLLSQTTGIDKEFLPLRKVTLVEENTEETDIDLEKLSFNELIVLKCLTQQKEETLHLIEKYGKIFLSDYLNYLIEYVNEMESKHQLIEKLENIPCNKEALEGALETIVKTTKSKQAQMNVYFDISDNESFEKSIEEIIKLKKDNSYLKKLLQEESLGHDDA